MSWSEGNYSLWCSSALEPRTARQVHLMLWFVFLCTCCFSSVLTFSLPAPVFPLFHVRCLYHSAGESGVHTHFYPSVFNHFPRATLYRRWWHFKTSAEQKKQQKTQIVEQKKEGRRGEERGSTWEFSMGLAQNEGTPLPPSMVLEETLFDTYQFVILKWCLIFLVCLHRTAICIRYLCQFRHWDRVVMLSVSQRQNKTSACSFKC